MDEDMDKFAAKWLQFKLDNAELIIRLVEQKSLQLLTLGGVVCALAGVALFLGFFTKNKDGLFAGALLLFVGVVISIVGYTYQAGWLVRGLG